MNGLLLEALENRCVPSAPEQQLFDSINAFRMANGVAPLAYDARLTAAGAAWIADLTEDNTYAHTEGPEVLDVPPDDVPELTGSDPTSRARDAGFPTAGTVAEALDAGIQSPTVQTGLAELINSPPHHALLLDPTWTRIGVAAQIGKGLLTNYYAIELGNIPGATPQVIGHAPVGQTVAIFDDAGHYVSGAANAFGIYSIDEPGDGPLTVLTAGRSNRAAAPVGQNFVLEPSHRNLPPADATAVPAWCYASFLYRGARPDEIASWRGQQAAGMTTAQLEAGFVSSAEYRSEHSNYLDALYTNLLFRPARADELQSPFWNNLTPQQIATVFLESPERAGLSL
jgi:uncharacterized protein YkwD